MTLKGAWEYGRNQLLEMDVTEASLDAWYLLEFVTHISRASYFGNPDKSITEEEWSCFQQLIAERMTRKPLQHITGIQEFMGLVFEVNEHVLIPRQDTEVLVETALDYIPRECTDMTGAFKEVKNKVSVLDMCTGSGCILISLMRMRNNVDGAGVDVSPEALHVAKRNGELNEVKPTWIESDLFENVRGEFDMIISNPPYIRSSIIEELEQEVKSFDPMLALDGKEDGLYFYREIIGKSIEYLKPQGMLLFEIGHDQGEEVSNYMIEKGFCEVTIKKDLAGLDRVVYGHVQ
ncbi:MAG: peptide chain release factor N(5)-glutamine methyltransferase [Eubacteriales bacterium]